MSTTASKIQTLLAVSSMIYVLAMFRRASRCEPDNGGCGVEEVFISLFIAIFVWPVLLGIYAYKYFALEATEARNGVIGVVLMYVTWVVAYVWTTKKIKTNTKIQDKDIVN
jgi:hypothetical protein